MAKTQGEIAREKLFERVDAIVHDGIRAMSDTEFKEFKKKSKKTISEIKKDAKSRDCDPPSGTEHAERPVLHA
jgi:hypothetical protein